MDLSFYVLLTLAGLVLLLAMWACAAAGTPKWGPDLTLHLPPEVIREALSRQMSMTPTEKVKLETEPSAPSELSYEPLLCNAQPMGISSPPTRPSKFQPAFKHTVVRVLPSEYIPQHRLHPVFSTFTTEERVK